MIIPGIGDGSKLRRDIKALLDVSKESGDMQYLATTEVQARLVGPTATNRLLGWDGTKPTWTTATAGPSFAAKADMEAATATTLIVTPEVFQNHPGLPKAWAYFASASATGLITGYNVSSVSRNALGDYTVNFITPFSSTDYAWGTSAEENIGTNHLWVGRNATGPNGQLASSFDLAISNSGGGGDDPVGACIFFYGDQ